MEYNNYYHWEGEDWDELASLVQSSKNRILSPKEESEQLFARCLLDLLIDTLPRLKSWDSKVIGICQK